MSKGKLRPDERAQALRARHPDYAHREKLIRICTGSSSAPVSYEDRIIELELFLSDMVLAQPQWKQNNLLRGLIRPWLQAVPEARGYCAHIYRAGRAEAGLLVPVAQLLNADGSANEAAAEQFAAAANARATAEPCDVKIEERSASWTDHAWRQDERKVPGF